MPKIVGDCYSPLKIFYHRDRIDQMRSGKRPSLLHIHLILTNRCNQKCNFCAYRAQGYPSTEKFNPKDEMPLAKAIETLDSCARLDVRAIEFTGGGEPTIHPDFVRVLNHAHKLGFDYGVVTNGTQASEAVHKSLSHASWVRVSIDAGNSSTYATTRTSDPSMFNKVRSFVRRLVVERTGDFPVVGVGFVITHYNWQEVFQAAVNAKEDGADNFRISGVFQNKGNDYFRKFYSSVVSICQQAEKLSNDRFRVFNLFGKQSPELNQNSLPKIPCWFQYLVTYIAADLNIYHCCLLAYTQRGFLASIADEPFDNVWLSEEVGERLLRLDANKCPYCIFEEKNRTITYAVQKDPPHVNFI